MNYHRFTLRLALAALAVLGLAGAASAQVQVPFKGSLEGTYTAVPADPSNPLILNVQLDAAGEASQLGAFTYDFPHVVDRTAIPSTGTGISTFTTANGDQVFAKISGEATLIVPGLLHGVEKGIITGGTGRFVNASGSFTIERLIDQAGGTTIGSFEGTISTPVLRKL